MRRSLVASCLGNSMPGRTPNGFGAPCAFLTRREKCRRVEIRASNSAPVQIDSQLIQKPKFPVFIELDSVALEYAVVKGKRSQEGQTRFKAILRADPSVKSSRSGVIEVQPFSTAQRSVPGSAFSKGVAVNQKCSRPRGSLSGMILPS